MAASPPVPGTTAGLHHNAALLDPNIFDEGQQLRMRWNIAIGLLSPIGQDYVIMLLEKAFSEPWNDGNLWIRWYKTNESYMKKYRFFSKQKQVDHEGQKVLTFSGLDTTCIAYVLEKLAEDSEKEVFKPLKELRNVNAHETEMEMSLQEYEGGFAQLLQIMPDLFKTKVQVAEKWVNKLLKVKNSPIQDPTIGDMLKQLSEKQEHNQHDTHNELAMLNQKLEAMQAAMKTRLSGTTPQISMPEMEKKFANSFKEHVRRHLSSIPIPASSVFMDLEETVLNQSMHRVLSEATSAEYDGVAGSLNVKKDEEILPPSLQTENLAEAQFGEYMEKEDSPAKPPDEEFTELWDPMMDRINADYHSDSSDSSSTSGLDFVQILFNEMCDAIESEIQRGNLKILITAAGGRGKTTAAKKLMYQWGQGKCLHSFFAVVRLDVKLLDMQEDLFENLLVQYPYLESVYSKEELDQVKEMFRTCQDRVLWMLDGLDESPSHHLTQRFLERNEQLFPRSVFLILTRNEGKKILDQINTTRAEFAMNNLNSEQCKLFMEKFPFSGKNASSKRSSLLQVWQENEIIKSVFPIPINAAMVCRLFDEDNFQGSFKDELEIFEAILAMNVKATLLKSIEMEIETCPSPEQQRSLCEEKEQLMEVDPLTLLQEKKELLVKLGHAIFICNGNSLIGFQNLEEQSLKKALKKLSLSEKEIKFLLRLDFFERKLVGSAWMFQFFHRNFRELIVSLYPSHTTSPMENQTEEGRLKDAHLSVLRCSLALIQKHEDKASSQQKIINIIQQILGSCISADEWRLVQVIGEAIQSSVMLSDKKSLLRNVLQRLMQLVDQRGFFIDEKMEELSSSNVIAAIYLHLRGKCENCHLPTDLKQKVRRFFEQELLTNSAINWPDVKPFLIYPIFAKDKDFVAFCLPGTGSVMSKMPHKRKHVNQSSAVVYYRKPQGLIRSPLPPPQLILSPVAYREKWNSTKGFLGGEGFVAQRIKNEIFVWGGGQFQSADGRWSLLPKNVIHVYNIKTKTWISIPAQGQIPTCSYDNASIANNDLIYISGGRKTRNSYEPSEMTNNFFTLHSAGVFREVEIIGALPSPRCSQTAWMYKDDIYLGFGLKVMDERTEFISGGDSDRKTEDLALTNQIVKLDLKANTYSNLTTTGSQPKPRADSGATRLQSKVFIHGGYSGLNDFHVLDMRTSQWSELRDFGLKHGASGQSLTALPPYQILLLGGGVGDSHISDKMMIFNARDSTWVEDQSLSEEFCGKGGGLRCHRAVSIEKGNRVSKIIYIGGYIAESENHHPSHVLELDIPS